MVRKWGATQVAAPMPQWHLVNKKWFHCSFPAHVQLDRIELYDYFILGGPWWFLMASVPTFLILQLSDIRCLVASVGPINFVTALPYCRGSWPFSPSTMFFLSGAKREEKLWAPLPTTLQPTVPICSETWKTWSDASSCAGTCSIK